MKQLKDEQRLSEPKQFDEQYQRFLQWQQAHGVTPDVVPPSPPPAALVREIPDPHRLSVDQPDHRTLARGCEHSFLATHQHEKKMFGCTKITVLYCTKCGNGKPLLMKL